MNMRLIVILFLSSTVAAFPNINEWHNDLPDHIHVVSDISILQHDTQAMRSRRDMSINQPLYDNYISISFNANGTKHAYNLERDCSAFDEAATFDFYEYSAEENDTILIDSLKPTCNHYQLINGDTENWISLKLRNLTSFEAVIVSKGVPHSVSPIKNVARSIDAMSHTPDDVVVMSRIQLPFSSHRRSEKLVNDGLRCGVNQSDHKSTMKRDKRNVVDNWRQCFDGQQLNKFTMPMHIAIDESYTKRYDHSKTVVMETLSLIMERTNQMFKAQFNIALTLSSSTIMLSPGKYDWNRESTDGGHRPCTWVNDKSGKDIYRALASLSNWALSELPKEKNYKKAGLVHLLSNCFNGPGTVGLANKGVLCKNGANVGISNLSTGKDGITIRPDDTWTTFAHEVGHNFNANHTFNVGGIMDYSDGLYNKVVQFHPNNKDEVCKEIRRAFKEEKDSGEKCFGDIRPNPHKLPYHWRPIRGHCEGICGDAYIKTSFDCYNDASNTLVNPRNCIYSLRPHSSQESCTLPFCTTSTRFVWRINKEAECTGTCGFGRKTMSYYCYDIISKSTAAQGDSSCKEVKPEPIDVQCNTGRACHMWVFGTWSACTKPCGFDGMRLKDARCETISGRRVENIECIHEYGHAIDDEVVGCNIKACTSLTRDEQCIHMKNQENKFLGVCKRDNNLCDELWCKTGVSQSGVDICEYGGKIFENTLCDEGTNICGKISRKCEKYSEPIWEVEEWGACNENCKTGSQKRNVKCIMSVSKQAVSIDMCRAEDKPLLTRPCICSLKYSSDHLNPPNDDEEPCSTYPCTPRFAWKLLPSVGECKGRCRIGVKTTHYYCHDNVLNLSAPRESSCEKYKKKPLPKKSPCITGFVCHQWASDVWSACSKHCGSGIKKKEVHCESIGGVVVDDIVCMRIYNKRLNEESKPCNIKGCSDLSRDQLCQNNIYGDFIGVCESDKDKCHAIWCQPKGDDSAPCNFGVYIDNNNTLCNEGKGFCVPNSSECKLYSEPIWTVGPWSTCNKESCETDSQIRVANCTMSDSGKIVSKDECIAEEKPITKRSCICYLRYSDIDVTPPSKRKHNIGVIVAAVLIPVMLVGIIVGIVVGHKKGLVKLPTFPQKFTERQSQKTVDSTTRLKENPVHDNVALRPVVPHPSKPPNSTLAPPRPPKPSPNCNSAPPRPPKPSPNSNSAPPRPPRPSPSTTSAPARSPRPPLAPRPSIPPPPNSTSIPRVPQSSRWSSK